MNIHEQFIMGKRPDQALCEDGLFISDSFVAVLDGVTSKSSRRFNNSTGGRAAMECAAAVLKKASADTSGAVLFESINNEIAALHNDTPTGEAAVCIIVYSDFHKEIWSLGDCQCIINDTYCTHEKAIDTTLSDIRARVIEEALRNGAAIEDITEHDVGREAILPQLKEQHLLANRTDHEYGYAVLNGCSFDHNSIITYPVKAGDTVILATDGYPRLYNTLQKSEEYLKHILTVDPLCFREYKSTKGIQKGNLSFDDRAYIKFSV